MNTLTDFTKHILLEGAIGPVTIENGVTYMKFDAIRVMVDTGGATIKFYWLGNETNWFRVDGFHVGQELRIEGLDGKQVIQFNAA